MKEFLRRPSTALVAAALALEAVFLAILKLGDLATRFVPFLTLALLAGIVYLVAVYLAERVAPDRFALWLILLGALAFRLTLLPLRPTLSEDLLRYRWEGRVQAAGFNPYTIAPVDERLRPLRDEQFGQMTSRNYPAFWPPLAQLTFRWLYRLGGSMELFKCAFLLFDLASIALLLALLAAVGRPRTAVLIYAWNPLVVIEIAGNGHYDSLAVAALVLASFLIIREAYGLSIAALAASAMLKLYAVWLLPVFAARRKVQSALIFAAVAGLSYLPFLSAGTSLISVYRVFAAKWRNNASLFNLLVWFIPEQRVAVGVMLGVMAGVAVYFGAWRPRTAGETVPGLDVLRASYLLIGLLLCISYSVFPWYIIWIVPFLCLWPNPAWLLLSVTAFLGHHVVIAYQATGEWRYSPFMLALEYAPFYALLLAGWWRKRAVGAALKGAAT